MRGPCGAVGASALISATITAFYDIQRARGGDFFVYPDYFLFHVGGPLGDHARLDVLPRAQRGGGGGASPRRCSRRSTTAASRGWSSRTARRAGLTWTRGSVASARGRIVTCLAYSPSGRVRDEDVRIAGNDSTEGYVEAILDPESRMERLQAGDDADRARADTIAVRAGEVPAELRAPIAAARAELLEDGRPVETYRRLDLDEALALL